MNASRRLPRRDEIRLKVPQLGFAAKYREMFRRRRRMHDPMLVFNMSIFNSPTAGNAIFGRHNVHTIGT
jgi:hypothetical protein